jgi:hypothetical protein
MLYNTICAGQQPPQQQQQQYLSSKQHNLVTLLMWQQQTWYAYPNSLPMADFFALMYTLKEAGAYELSEHQLGATSPSTTPMH